VTWLRCCARDLASSERPRVPAGSHLPRPAKADRRRRPERSCGMLPASLIWLALRLAPRGQELEHTSYFETDPEPHPATWGHVGRRRRRCDPPRRSNCSQAVNPCAEVNFEKEPFICMFAPRARLERATYCSGGTFPTSPDIAWCRLTSAPAAAKIAGRSLTSPGDGGRWLPVWLPGISSATLTFGRSAACANPMRDPSRPLPRSRALASLNTPRQARSCE
jgi:hypothetical protein